MGIWQIIWIVLMVLSLGIIITKHGEERSGKWNFWTALGSVAIETTILFFGGFFTGQ